jgi:DnaJ-class molecular chaperone
MIILTCRRCKGNGSIENDQYRLCQEIKSHEIRKYFHMPMDVTTRENEEPRNGCNGVPEYVECPDCDGAGVLSFDEDEWDLQIIDEEAATGEE